MAPGELRWRIKWAEPLKGKMVGISYRAMSVALSEV
jgi:hypothetical protein